MSKVKYENIYEVLMTSDLHHVNCSSKANSKEVIVTLSDPSLTLMFRSKFKYEDIFEFLGFDFLYPVNTNFCSQINSKVVIEHWNYDFSYLWKDNQENISHIKLPRANLRKNLLEMMKLFLFISGPYCSGEGDF
jgi:hypothetical protein